MGNEERAGRRGGRHARVASRAAPLEKDLRPISKGMEGGLYKPLSDADMDKIHNTACQLLEEVGLGSAIPSSIDYITKAGGWVNDRGRVCIPRSLVEDTVKIAARNFTLFAQDPEWDLEPWGDKVHFGTAGAAVHVVDPITREYRNSTCKDLYNAARLVDQLDNIHFFQRSMVCRDIEDPRLMDVNTCFAAVSGTRKHVGSSWVLAEHFRESMKMLHTIAGGEKQWRKRPFVSQSNCFVVPPMKFAEDACSVLEEAVHAGMPILLLAAGQAGATSPAALAGAVTQEVAEVLAGLVYVNAIKPGHPCIFGTWPFVSDLRSGAMCGGSGEQALLMAGCAQMSKYYNVTGGVCAGMTDSKEPDFQAGAENGLNYALVAHSGANLIYESGGMHASLLGFCHHTLLLADDAIGATLRTIRGIEVTDDNLSFEVIKHACLEGPGHYLGSNQTLERMQRDYVYPNVGNRLSPNEWKEVNRPSIIEEADAKMKILLQNSPQHIPASILEQIRVNHEILLQ